MVSSKDGGIGMLTEKDKQIHLEQIATRLIQLAAFTRDSKRDFQQQQFGKLSMNRIYGTFDYIGAEIDSLAWELERLQSTFQKAGTVNDN